MLNHITIIGRLVADPELRHTPNGSDVATFRIACDRDFTKESDEKKADFFNCVAWRSTAAFVAQYFTKGRAIVLDGRLQQREYTTKDGEKRTAVEITAEHVYFGDSKPQDGGSGNSMWVNKTAMAGNGGRQQAGTFVETDGDGDLPF